LSTKLTGSWDKYFPDAMNLFCHNLAYRGLGLGHVNFSIFAGKDEIVWAELQRLLDAMGLEVSPTSASESLD
jgi:hypothetical protein